MSRCPPRSNIIPSQIIPIRQLIQIYPIPRARVDGRVRDGREVRVEQVYAVPSHGQVVVRHVVAPSAGHLAINGAEVAYLLVVEGSDFVTGERPVPDGDFVDGTVEIFCSIWV